MILVAVVAGGIGGYFEAVRLTTLRAKYQSHAQYIVLYEKKVATLEKGVKILEEMVSQTDEVRVNALTPQRRQHRSAQRDYYEQKAVYWQADLQSSRALLRYHTDLSRKYARAAGRPWLGVSPDPPHPAPSPDEWPERVPPEPP